MMFVLNWDLFVVSLAVNRFRERVGLQRVNERDADEVADEVDDDSQTGVYDNITNVQQQLTRQRGRTRRDQYVNHVDTAVHVDHAGGTNGPAVTDGAETAATLNSMLSADWTSSVRRRGRCADRLASNRVIGPSFVSSARVQLDVNGGLELKPQHSEQSLSAGDDDDLSYTVTPETTNDDATSTTTAGTETDPPWNGYDNIIELKEAICSSTVARMAAGYRTKTGAAAAASTAVPGGGTSARDDGLLVASSSSSRVIGERVVDVHRQRLSATGRHVDDGIQTATSTTTRGVDESSVEMVASSDTSRVTDAAPTSSANAAQTQNHSDAAGNCVDASHTAHSDSSVTNDGAQQKKKTVSFEKEDADSSETKLVADRGRKHRNKDKPPAGKAGNDFSKKSDKKSEQRKEKKEHNSAAAGSEQQDELVGKTEQQPVSKMSFLRNLLTRSRSPSPKRASSNSNDGSSSTLSLSRDVAKRLSEPLKSSFKQPSDAPVVKVSVKQRDKKKKKPSAEDKKRSEQTADPKDNSNCKGISMVNSADEPETLVPSPAACTTMTPDDGSETSPLSKAESLPAATNNTNCTEQKDIANMSPSSVACQSTETAVVVTTVSQLPMSGTAAFVSSTSDVVGESPERRRSATVITLRSAAGNESTPNHRQSASQTGATLSSNEICNPWLVNLREFRMRPNLDSFEGEKVFRKGTATTRLVLPGFARSQQDFLSSSDGEPLRSEMFQRLTTTRKLPSELRERHSAITSPIYDAVYEENPASICKSTTELLGNRFQSQRAEDIGKSYSLQDIKQRTGTLQTSTVCGDEAAAGRIRTLTTTEHAIDDDELRNNIGYVAGDSSGTSTTPLKLVKTVTFRDDVDANCSHVDRRLESAQGLSKTDTSMDAKASRDFCAAVPAGTAAGSTGAPVTGVDRCAKMSKSSSLPACRLAPPTVHCSSVDMRDNVSALRDTITSCDLDELPKYLADMYRQQKLERQREQELAARDRQRLENIEKMWKELENHLTTTTTTATSVTSCTKAEPSEDHVPDGSQQTMQRKHKQQVLMYGLYVTFAAGTRLI